MADIFISYSQKDRDWVRKLGDALTAEGYEVWWDLDIRAGESIGKAIERMLPLAKCVVVVWSQAAKESDWVRAESAWAKERNKLVSIRIQDELELPIDFYHILTDNFSTWDGSSNAHEFRKLVTDIRKIAGPPPASPETAPIPGPESLSAPRAEPEQAAVVQPTREPLPRTEPAPRSEPKPPPGPGSSVPGRRGFTVGMTVLTIAALAGGFFYAGTRGVFNSGGKPGRPTVVQDQGEAAPLPAFRDTLKDGSQGPEMIPIQGGTFQMGCVSGTTCGKDELPVHPVQIHPFAMGRTEVTFDQYDQFAVATGRTLPKDKNGWGRGDRPVINVTWDQARKYAIWLSERTGKHYRLPTEAEWEYATRAGTKTPFSTGDCIYTDQANYDGNNGYMDCGAKIGVYREKTVQSGSLPANPWGLHEVHGNVWEWTEDCWHDSYEGAPKDGSAWEEESGGKCGRRVLRGGSWYYLPWNLLSAHRGRNYTDFRLDNLGFRLAQDL